MEKEFIKSFYWNGEKGKQTVEINGRPIEIKGISKLVLVIQAGEFPKVRVTTSKGDTFGTKGVLDNG